MILEFYGYVREHDNEIDPGREARQTIYLLAVFTFTLNAVIFGTDLIPNVFFANLAMVVAILFAASYLINKYIDKLSMHVAMYAFVVMLLTGKVNNSFAILFIFLPVIIWSRIVLKKHTWLQILLGLAIGMAIGILAWTS